MMTKKRLHHIMLDNNTSLKENMIIHKQMFHELYLIFIHDGAGHYCAYKRF